MTFTQFTRSVLQLIFFTLTMLVSVTATLLSIGVTVVLTLLLLPFAAIAWLVVGIGKLLGKQMI